MKKVRDEMQDIQIEQILHRSSLYQQAVQLRQAILRTPLGLAFTAEQLAAEKDAIHFVALSEGLVVGAVFLHRYTEDTLQVRQMVVAPTFERRGIGRQLLRAAIAFAAAQKGVHEVMMHARVSAVPFYEKEGFQSVGDVFEELTIPHITMRQKMGS